MCVWVGGGGEGANAGRQEDRETRGGICVCVGRRVRMQDDRKDYKEMGEG